MIDACICFFAVLAAVLLVFCLRFISESMLVLVVPFVLFAVWRFAPLIYCLILKSERGVGVRGTTPPLTHGGRCLGSRWSRAQRVFFFSPPHFVFPPPFARGRVLFATSPWRSSCRGGSDLRRCRLARPPSVGLLLARTAGGARKP